MIIYLAAVEETDVKPALEADLIRHGFSSYFYLRKRPQGVVQFVRQHLKRHVVDSGAHSFFSSSDTHDAWGVGLSAGTPTKARAAKREDPEAYWAGYLKWLVANADSLDHFVELDIGEIVGQDRVRAWRQQIAKAGLAEKAIICYHPAVQSLSSFIDEAKRWPSRYVGLQGLRRGRGYDIKGAVRACYENSIACHGFAMVKPKYLDAIPYYSVDSASHKASIMWGTALVEHKGRIHYMSARGGKNPKSRARLAKLSVSNGLPLNFAEQVRNPFSRHGGKTLRDVLGVSSRAIQKMEDYYTSLWLTRGIRWEERLAKARSAARPRSSKSRSKS